MASKRYATYADLLALAQAMHAAYEPRASRLYGTCSTVASTNVKAVSIAGVTELYHGLTIRVRFVYTNNSTGNEAKLNVNDLGAKPIYVYGTQVPGNAPATSWRAGALISLTYDTDIGSTGCWVMNDSGGNLDGLTWDDMEHGITHLTTMVE